MASIGRRVATQTSDAGLGMRCYATSGDGIGGSLKSDPTSFRVEEVSKYPPPSRDGKFVVARVESTDIEQNELLRRLAQDLSLQPGSISIAGTKDRRAVSTQLVSFPTTLEALKSVSLSGVKISEAYTSSEGLYLGYSYGNNFDIEVRDLSISPEECLRRTSMISSELERLGGFPNYFGPQRFGEVRPITHLVGRCLVKGSVQDAVDTYLTCTPLGQDLEGNDARSEYAKHHDPVRALKEFPSHFRFERILLERLARGDSAERALHALPRYLKTLFVHAYQSFIFNECMSERLECKASITKPVVGDYVLHCLADGTWGGSRLIEVSDDNLGEVDELVSMGTAAVCSPMPGVDTPMLNGVPGEILEKVMGREDVRRADFNIRNLPKLTSTGTWRVLCAKLPYWFFRGPAATVKEGRARFRFTLDKGVYATVLMREFMKTGSQP